MRYVAVYARVSTKRQSTKSQEPDLRRWAESQDEPVKWYRDQASGKTMDRPQWNKLESDIRCGKVSQVVVWRIDRLGRTATGLTKLFDELRERKVNLVSLKDGLDLSTAAGRLMANVLASISQFEVELKGERVLAGQARAKAEGRRWGGSLPGVRKRVKPEQERFIRQLRDEGASIVKISKLVGFSRPTIYSVLASK